MTVKDLIRLCGGDLDKMIILKTELNGEHGWTNIDWVKTDGPTVYIEMERNPLFHD